MDKLSQLKTNFQKMVGANPNYPVDAIVRSIQDDTCTVEIDGLELSDVRLKATADGSDTLLVIPAINSNVLLLSSDGSIDNLTVIKADKAQKIIFKQNGLHVEIDSTDGKVSIKNSSISLFDIFQALATLLKQLKVYTPAGPSGTPLPDSILAINQFETNFKKILK